MAFFDLLIPCLKAQLGSKELTANVRGGANHFVMPSESRVQTVTSSPEVVGSN